MSGSKEDKDAFAAMMDEIGDSDEEDLDLAPRGGKSYLPKSVTSMSAQPKSPVRTEASTVDAKGAKSHAQQQHRPSYFDQQAAQQERQSQFKVASDIENFGSGPENVQAASDIRRAEVAETKRWLTRPCRPDDPPVRCFVERDRSGFNRLHPVYRLYLEPQPGNGQQLSSSPAVAEAKTSASPANPAIPGARFLMYATKQSNSKTSSFLFSCDQSSSANTIEDRGSEFVVGKLKGNAVGSQYLIVDNGRSPEKATGPSTLRREFGVVRFEFDSGGPSMVETWVPAVNANGSIVQPWQPSTREGSLNTYIEHWLASGGETKGSSSSSSDAKGSSPAPGPSSSSRPKGSTSSAGLSTSGREIDPAQYRRILMLRNKRPKWDEQHGGHVLNFQGRVTQSSVKNFQLCLEPDWFESSECRSTSNTASRVSSPQNPNADVVLQFGKVAADRFTMDVQFPLSVYQAYSICVACMDGKLADRRGYEYIKRLTGYSSGGGGGGNEEAPSSSSGAGGGGSAGSGADEKVVEGNLTGARGLRGSILESMPSSAYLAEKMKRSSWVGKD